MGYETLAAELFATIVVPGLLVILGLAAATPRTVLGLVFFGSGVALLWLFWFRGTP